MTPYNSELFDPPAPLAAVEVRGSDRESALITISMLIDSGADVTLVPKSCVDNLGITVVADQTYELMGFDGSRSFAPVVWVEMIFLKRIFRGRFLIIDQEWGILGRDVLNHLPIVLDGPKLSWGEAPR
ncbi:retropepsin-like aspartic protease [Candidatus Promineifilum breve]|nr:retropepsin-like aspartic protease [Candidatus Promineifilum breve]